MRTIRRKELRDRTGLSNSQIDRMEASGQFPARVRLSERTVAWVEGEIDAWLAGKVELRDKETAGT